MGPCAAGLSNRSQRQLPIIFECETPSSQLNSSLEHEFQFQLSNVCVLPLRNSKLDISFIVSDIIKIDMLKANMQINQANKHHIKDNYSAYEVKWNQSNSLHFTLTQTQLAEKNIQIFISFEAKQPIEILRLSLYLIANGPYHHNIEINYQGENFRILFDAKISHLFETQLEVAQLNLQTNQNFDASLCHFTLRALLHQQQIVTQSQPSYSLHLYKTKQLQSNISSKFFQQECPSPKNLRKIGFYYGLSQQNQAKQIIWKVKEGAKISSQTIMPSLTVDVSTRQISQNSIQLIVWSNQTQNEAKYLCQARIPLWKLLEKQHTDNIVIMGSKVNKPNSVCIEERRIKLKDKLYCHHNIIGNFEIVINMKNQKLIEQIKYCSRTEEGIVNLAPSALKKDIKSDSETIHELWKQMEQIDQIMRKIGSSNSKFQGLKSQIGLKLIKINDKLVLRKDELLYSDANKFQSLMNNQNILITFIQKMYPFIQLNQNSTLSNLGWQVILNIFKRNQFTLENLGLKGVYKTPEAKAVFNRKRDVGLKYHQTINRLIQCAINNYEMDRFSDHQITNKFLSFCFFRVVKFRQCFFRSVKINKDDRLIEMQLLQVQRQMEPRTSFNNPLFKMMLDWQKYFYDELKDDSSIMKQELSLVNLKNVKFFSEMDSRAGLFYDFVSQVLKSLPKLSAGGTQKWKYIEGYSTLVSILLSEMKLRPIQKFMTGIIQTSLLLLQNEHLINILMPLICQKVNVYDIGKVQIVFDLITEFFQVLTHKKTSCLPPTFNQNYLFKIIKILIEGEHFYNTNRILILIFNFYTFMSELGKYQIAMYFMGSVFFKLFYHWSHDVRNIFYNILLIRFQYADSLNKDKIKTRFTKILAINKIIFSIHEQKHKSNHLILQKDTLKKLKNKIYDKIHQRKQKNTSKTKNQYSLNIILQQCQDECTGRSSEQSSRIQGEDLRQSRTRQIFSIPTFRTADNLSQDKKKKTLSGRFTVCQEYSIGQITPQKNNEEVSQTFVRRRSENIAEHERFVVGTNDCSGRKKRKPSLFLPTKNLSSIKQYTSTIVNQLHSLSELSRDQVKNITNAKLQFEQIEKQINRYSSTHDGAFPERNFLQKNSKELAA